MDVVVTGSSGFIGTALVEALSRAGHRPIRLLRRRASGDVLAWDPERGTVDRAGLEGVDAVIHLAGEGIATRRWSDEQKRRILESRTKGTSLLASTLASLQRPPQVLVSASGVNYYGDRGDEIVTEATPHGRGFLTDVTLAWEAAAGPARQAGIRVAHSRSGVVLSPRGSTLKRILPLYKLGLGGRLGSGRQYWSWITLDDEVRAFLWLLDHDLSGPVNFTAPEPVTNAEFTTALGRALHRPTIFAVPEFGPKLVLGAELATQLLFTSARVVPRKLLDGGFEFRHTTITEAFDDLLAR
jgi:uncharacterized protein